MTHLVADAGLQGRWQIDSAGTIGIHAGDAADARMRAAARQRGFDLTSRARQIRAEDLEEFDLILAMDRSNLADIRKLSTDPTAEIVLFSEFCTRHEAIDVPDPYYGGAEGFEVVLDLLEDGCAEILRQWREDDR